MNTATKQQVPEGYQQTEVGVIPADWSVGAFSEYVWYQEGPGLRNWQFTRKGMKVINVTNLQYSGLLNLDKTDRHISLEEFEKMYRHFECDAGDFVMASSGNSYCKASVVRENDLPLLMNTSVIRFKPRGSMVNGYMQAYMKSKYFKEQIDLLITGGAQPNFGPFHLNKILLPIPAGLKEQDSISCALSDVDALITSLEKLIAKKRAIKTAAMQQLLTGKTRLPPFDKTHTGYKQTELGEIPEDWECIESGDAINYFGGYGFSSRLAASAGVKWLKIANVGLNEIKWDAESFLPESLTVEFKNYELNPDDIVMALTRPILSQKLKIARIGICDSPSLLNQRVARLDAKPFHQIDFLYYVVQRLNFIAAMNLSMAGTDPPNIGTVALGKIEIAVPSDEQEQTAIANVLSDVDADIFVLEKRLNKTQQLKQGMMQELLTGRTRLV